MKFDHEQVTKIIRETAEAEILPRFERLSEGDISEKSPGDLVTIADIESEKVLSRRLTELLPGSVAIGEEGVAADPATLNLISGDKPVWIIDPVDGTHNFAHSVPCFAVIVCLVHRGEILSGWIHDPIENATLYAKQGEGAWDYSQQGGERLTLSDAKPIDQMTGSLKRSDRHKVEERRSAGEAWLPTIMKRYRCVGREYMDLARGKFDFASYSGTLKPWDHAAGILIYREAGGVDVMDDQYNIYEVEPRLIKGEVMLAPNEVLLKHLSTSLRA
ncbi:MAG: inositol monophosphatase [Rhodospirillales bacterium]|jgi:fructose-1,6-bisphosphatase/inositol monophosphatase family enzyme|tara:strand:+ start:2751 stop:3572 length:822 start_codon:yes stop_codon:yes gene_type:complete